MSTNEECTEIVPFRYTAYDIAIQFDFPSESNLSLSHLTGIYNAWKRGVQVDSYGRIWISQSELHNVLRTTKDNARYFLLNIEGKYQYEEGGITYVQGSEVYRILDTIIQSAGSPKREQYARFSDDIYRAMRDCDFLKVVRYEFYDNIRSHKKELKKIRIERLKITVDELTGKSLSKKNSDFSHIRKASIYLHLADKYWNGLIVNKETHAIIDEENINDEEQLLDLCENNGWETDWYSIFRQCLNSY